MLIITCATQAVYMDLPPCGTDVVSAQVTHPNGIIWDLTVSTVRHEDGSARVALTNWPYPPAVPAPPPPAPVPPPISAGAYTVTVTTGCGCHTVQVYLRCPPPAFQPVDMTPPGTPRPYVSCTSTSEDEPCLPNFSCAITPEQVQDALAADPEGARSAAQAEQAGSAANLLDAHEAALDPHPQYTTTAEAAAAAPVQSVNGLTGVVTLTPGLIGAAPTSHTHSLADLTQSSATTGQVPTWTGGGWMAMTPPSAPDLSGYATITYVNAQDAATLTAANAYTNAHTWPLSAITQSSASTGQVATWNGSAWAPASLPVVSFPVTTKGDLFTYASSPARLPVGPDGTTLIADSTTLTGLRWVGVPSVDVSNTPALPLGPTASAGTGVNASRDDHVHPLPSLAALGAASASHTHPLSAITQSGATLNQVATWNGSAWAPATPTPGGGSSLLMLDMFSGTDSTIYGSGQKRVVGQRSIDPSATIYGLGPSSTATLYVLLATTDAGSAACAELFQMTGTGSPQIIAATTTTTSLSSALVSADVSAAFTDTSPSGIFAVRVWTASPDGTKQAVCYGAWLEIEP